MHITHINIKNNNMSYISEAKQLINKIETHSHYYSCYSVSPEYSSFNKNKQNLNRIKKCFEDMNTIESQIINDNNEKNNKQKLLDNIIETTNEKYNNEKKRLENEEDIHKRKNEKILKELKNEYEFNQINKKNELIKIEQDILNLKEEINKFQKEFNYELDLKKKEISNKIINDYQIKLLKYENEKKLEKQKIETEELIKKQQFEADKEIELNELRNKSELTQNIIAMYKQLNLL